MRPLRILLVTLLFSAAATSAASAADDGANDQSDVTPSERHWYGWPLLISDTASLVTAVVALEGRDSRIGLGIAGATYAFGPAAVHLLHGNPARAMGSVALRVGLPLLGAYLMDGTSDCGPGSRIGCGYGDAIAGFMLGASAAIAIDHVMSIDRHAPARDPRYVRATRRPPAMDVTPTLAVHPRGGALGLVGRF